MRFSEQILDAAHKHSANNRNEISESTCCGCFFCLAVISSKEITDWLADESDTALCPSCGIDSVIGEAAGYPTVDRSFLEAMKTRWFGTKAD